MATLQTGTAPNQIPTNGDLGDLAFQSKESVQFTGGRGALSSINLNQIYKEIAATAVDVFVYDTSRDSDGGAWRNRTQHTSWYNETLNTATRGSRREFPSVAVIVATTTSVTIYDGDDPVMPMWMVFNQGGSWPNNNIIGQTGSGSLTSVVALNGIVSVSLSADTFRAINFISELTKFWWGAYYREYKGFIVSRNSSSGWTDTASPYASIPSPAANDVAMTVLTNAPIDAATGLPIPTIAVATNGGTSIIHNNGTVVNITCNNGSYTTSRKVDFLPGGALGLSLENSNAGAEDSYYVFNNIPYASTVITVDTKVGSPISADAFYSAQIVNTAHVSLFTVGNQTDTNRTLTKSSRLNFATPFGLTQIAENRLNPPFGMVNGISSKYNTGWMPGNIKGAWLSDNTAETMVGTELVTSGDMSSSTGWTISSGISISGGVATYASPSHGSNLQQTATSFIAGKSYTISFSVTSYTSGRLTIYANYATSAQLVALSAVTGTGTYAYTWIASANGAGFTLQADAVSSGACSMSIDNVSIRLADADRSVNNKGLQVFGNITKTPVATGADLVGYSFPTTSGYFEQPYNSAIGGVGTGDFCVMGWFRNSPSETTWFDIASDASPRFFVAPMYGATDNVWIYMNTAAGTFNWNPSPAFPVVGKDYWQFIAVKRSGITISVSLNGSAWSGNTTITAGGSLNSTSRVTIGQNYTHGAAAHTGQMALWRFSQTAPSAEQIAKIYNDEKYLFQDNAKATLYGSSDSVTALAYDEDTQLLHAGTSSGRSVFRGLRRVDNTTTAVDAAISAANGLVAED